MPADTAGPATLEDFGTIVFPQIVQIALGLVGVAFTVMLIIASFQYVTAAGDKEATQRAQKTINYALRGFVLTISAWIIIALFANFIGLDMDLFSTFTLLLR